MCTLSCDRIIMNDKLCLNVVRSHRHRQAYSWSSVWLDVVILCLVINISQCFNIDVKNPVIFEGPPGSHFGYSVGILAKNNGAWILIGAPKANDSNLPDVKRSGALYKCSPDYPNHCQIVEIHSKGNIKQTVEKWKNVTLFHSKNDQWLGASIDINTDGDWNVVVCAPRWRDREYHVQGHEFMNGLCYESGKDLEFTETSVWPALEFFKKQIHETGYYVYGMGMLGSSVQYSKTSICYLDVYICVGFLFVTCIWNYFPKRGSYTKDGRYLLMGAPGVNDWTGGYARVSGGHKERPKVNQPSRHFYNNSYIGYSITTAALSADAIYTVVGGPRAENKGKIFVYDDKFDIMLSKEGEQFGSYFGSSVCAVDLNGDSLDDLVVGAPLHTVDYDEGRVFVYINQEFFNLEPTSKPLVGSNTPAARFGTTLMNVKDLNNDGFEDIAVGAPFEGNGVVYIYNGQASGIHLEYSQRIVGENIRASLSGFGWSISRPFDVNGDRYNDLVIGSFVSDSAVLLAGRPVIDLVARLDIQPRIIDPDGTPNCLYLGAPAQCVKAKACFKYYGVSLPATYKLSFVLNLDTIPRHRRERQRLFIFDRYGDETEVIKDTIQLRQDNWNCGQSYTVFTKKSRDIVTPLQFDLNYTLSRDKTTPACHICPLVNVYNPSSVTERVSFMKDCGADDICQADLVLKTTLIYKNNEKYLILDNAPSFEVQVVLYNTAELAYLTVVRFRYPKNVHYGRVKSIVGNSDIICLSKALDSQNHTNTMECDISHPLRSREEIIFTVRFMPEKFSFNLKEFDIFVEAETASEELNPRNNNVTATIEARVKSALGLTGAAIPAQIHLKHEEDDDVDEDGDWVEMKHVFDVRNHGPSPFPRGYIELLSPNSRYVSVKDVQIRSEDPTYTVGKGCIMKWTPDINGPRASFKLVKYEEAEEKSDFITESELRCSSKECLNITCSIDTLEKNQGVFLTITFDVKKSILQDLKVKEEIRFVSTARLTEPYFSTYISLTEIKFINATTYILPIEASRRPFQIWVLAISIVCGLLLLYLLSLLLWKCGFFKRKRREELRKLIKAAETERIANLTSHSVSDVNDVMILPPNNNIFMSMETTTFTHLNNHNNHWPQPPAFSNDTYLQPINMNS